MSELVREALRRYEAMQRLRELQAYGKKRAAEVGIKEEDKEEEIDRLIHEYRAERRSRREEGGRIERKAS
jgi:Arc/MetJ-type ribon-helix-helix transcriptional regulator